MNSETQVADPQRPRRRHWFVRWWTGAALMLFNTLVFFIVLNLVLWPVLAVGGARLAKVNIPEEAKKVFGPMSEAERNVLAREIYNRSFIFDQWVQIKEAPFTGKYLNVSEHGFRMIPQQGPWPIDRNNFNVFVFGGSTTFGYGVADWQTVPAQMQSMLGTHAGKRVCVYNFGRCYYYSTPERILFQHVLMEGARPDVAIFIDGLNDFGHADGIFEGTVQLQPVMAAKLSKAMAYHATAIMGKLPIGKVARFVALKAKPEVDNNPSLLPVVVQRYVFNKRTIEAVGKEHGVRTAFVFQPVPVYKYDVNDKLFRDSPDVRDGYPLMAKYVAENAMGENFLWLADIQQGVKEPLYCDAWHYSGAFCKEITQQICKFVFSKSD